MEKQKQWYEKTWFYIVLFIVGFGGCAKMCSILGGNETPDEKVIRLHREDSINQYWAIKDSIQAVKDSIYQSTPEYKAQKLKQDQLKVIHDIKEDCEYYDVGGYFFRLNWEIEQALDNPDSFEHVRTKMSERPKDGCIYVEVKFRGTNAFNAVVTQIMYFKLYPGCKVIVVD